MGIMDTIQAASSIISGIENGEIRIKLTEVINECYNLSMENIKLKDEIKDLKDKLETKESLKFKDGAYWTKDGDGPFCSSCWDSDQKLIRTHKKPHILEMICPNCKNTYVTEEQREQSAKNSMSIASLNKTNDWNF